MNAPQHGAPKKRPLREIARSDTFAQMEPSLFSDVSTFALLVGLELVLGIDNVLLISILSDRLPADKRPLARKLGLGLALVIRLLMVLGAGYLTRMTDEVFLGRSWKDIVLLAGGAFLLFKSVKEIHHAVEGDAHEEAGAPRRAGSLSSIVLQIVLLDIVFSIDSVITAVGLTSKLWVIESAVIASFVLVLLFASRVSAFIQNNPALKVLALSFLVCIGVTLGMEGMGKHVDKGYIYLPMGFALLVELLQMKQSKNVARRVGATKHS